jgi:hypothetical protein
MGSQGPINRQSGTPGPRPRGISRCTMTGISCTPVLIAARLIRRWPVQCGPNSDTWQAFRPRPSRSRMHMHESFAFWMSGPPGNTATRVSRLDVPTAWVW